MESTKESIPRLSVTNIINLTTPAKEEEPNHSSKSCAKSLRKSICNFYEINSFIIGVIIAILLAKAYPPLGAYYLYPHITATWIAVFLIFILAGLGLKSEELNKAFTRLFFNSFVQVFNFFFISSLVFGITTLLLPTGIISKPLSDGMVISSCLPLTMNTAVVLSISSGGDEAASIFNSVFSNIVGVFLSPMLVLLYLGISSADNVDIITIFIKLGLRVLLPISIGQILRVTSKNTVSFVKHHKRYFKKGQEVLMIFIVYTIFCQTFISKDAFSGNIKNVLLMVLFQFILLTSVMGIAWTLLKFFFIEDPRLRISGLFGCSHKSMAMGILLINAIFEGNDNIALYTLPILIWHPMQLFIGSALAPRLNSLVEAEIERLKVNTSEEDLENAATESENNEEE